MRRIIATEGPRWLISDCNGHRRANCSRSEHAHHARWREAHEQQQNDHHGLAHDRAHERRDAYRRAENRIDARNERKTIAQAHPRRRYEQDIKALRAPAACNSRGLGRQWRVSDSTGGGHATSMERGSLMLNTTTFVGLDVHARSIKAVALDAMTGEVRSATFAYDAAAVAEWVGSLTTLPQSAFTSPASPGSTCRRSSRRWASTASSARFRR